MRDASEHRLQLLEQLDNLERSVKGREADLRVADASREILVARPAEGFDLVASRLGDKDQDIRVVSDDPETGIVIFDAPDAKLQPLRNKIEAYASDKRTPKGRRRNEPFVAPLANISEADFEDLSGRRFDAASLDSDRELWFELACRGGARVQASQSGDSANSRSQILEALTEFGDIEAPEFETPERLLFYVRLTVDQLRRLISRVECVYEFDLASSEVVRWLIDRSDDVVQMGAVNITAPDLSAPSIVLLDTGIVSSHPLLQPLLLPGISALPGDSSSEDTNGHGTNMAGLAAFTDLAAVLTMGSHTSDVWLQSARLLSGNNVGSATDRNRPFWALITTEAVQGAEMADPEDRPRVFAMATTAEAAEPGVQSAWSHAVDLLAFNDGEATRLLCLSVGNLEIPNLQSLANYPNSNLANPVLNPAQAINVLTIGGVTHLTSMPPDPDYSAYQPKARQGAPSPHTRSGILGDAIKPDIVFEAGNVAFDGSWPNASVPSLVMLTTGREFLNRPVVLVAGTSAANASAAHAAATVMERNPELRPETVRGLLVHAATWTEQMLLFPLDERLQLAGYGVPDVRFATECANNRATMYVEDDLPNRVVNPDGTKSRPMKLFRLPVPDDLADDTSGEDVELRVTLSYFGEPRRVKDRYELGIRLAWDMQGPQESEAQFLRRVNRLQREADEARDPNLVKDFEKSYVWEVGPSRRSRGTVQSDRWSGPASFVSGSKLVAVYPILGWWDRREHLQDSRQRFSLIVSLRVSAGIDIYSSISQSISADIEVDA